MESDRVDWRLQFKVMHTMGIRTMDSLVFKWSNVSHRHVVYFDQQMHAYAIVYMVENNEKRLKITIKVLFSSCALETHVRLTQEHEEKCSFIKSMFLIMRTRGLCRLNLHEIAEEQPAFECQPAFGS